MTGQGPEAAGPGGHGIRFAIQTRGLRKTYGRGEIAVEALRGVDIDVRRGEFVSIMGSSGSGKSTLLHLVGLLDAPTDGAICVMGQPASHLSARQRTLARREHLGFVFQAFHLLPRATATQNVMLPMALAGMPRARRRPRAIEVLRSVGLGDRVDHRPNELSGGQKQRVAIARALALDPPIILADEPTGNLDSQTSGEVMDLFKQLNRRGKTIIQVTHESDIAACSSRTILIQDGRVAGGDGRLGGWQPDIQTGPGAPPKTPPRRARAVGRPRVVFKESSHDRR